MASLYCRLIDMDGNECMVKMAKTGQENNYNIYQVVVDSSVCTIEGLTEVMFIAINHNNTMKTIHAGKMHIKYDNFSIAHRLYLMNELSKSIQLTYNKVEELTRMNLQLYKDIREVTGR